MRTYHAQATQFVTWCQQCELSPATATEEDIIAYRKHLVEAGYKPTTVALKLAVVRRLYEAIRWRGLRHDNPAAGIKAPDFTKSLDGLETNRINQLVVHKTLQCLNDENIFAIGDTLAQRDAPGVDLENGLATPQVAAGDNDLVVAGDYLYLAGGRLGIVDISDPADPQLVSDLQ